MFKAIRRFFFGKKPIKTNDTKQITKTTLNNNTLTETTLNNNTSNETTLNNNTLTKTTLNNNTLTETTLNNNTSNETTLNNNTLTNPTLNNNTLTKLNSIENFDIEHSIPFTFPVELAKCVSVYDGDTITILFKLTCDITKNQIIYRHNVRLNGLDCPEMKDKKTDRKTLREPEKEIAIMAKKRVEGLILGKVIKIKNIVPHELYGRILADVFVDDIWVNKILLDERLAIPYDGKTKMVPKNWKVFYETGSRD